MIPFIVFCRNSDGRYVADPVRGTSVIGKDLAYKVYTLAELVQALNIMIDLPWYSTIELHGADGFLVKFEE